LPFTIYVDVNEDNINTDQHFEAKKAVDWLFTLTAAENSRILLDLIRRGRPADWDRTLKALRARLPARPLEARGIGEAA
jgi:hypothetical protein